MDFQNLWKHFALPDGKNLSVKAGRKCLILSLYMVIVSGKKLVSKISEGQKKLLERLELKLEVD